MRTAFNVFEKILLLLLIVSFSFLLFIQISNYNEDYAINTSRFRDSNTSLFNNGETIEKGIIIIKNLNESYKNVSILVNGEYVCDFSKSAEVHIYVYHNDIIEIDGTKYNEDIHFKIVGVSKNIDSPQLDTILTTSQSIEILGKVKLK